MNIVGEEDAKDVGQPGSAVGGPIRAADSECRVWCSIFFSLSEKEGESGEESGVPSTLKES